MTKPKTAKTSSSSSGAVSVDEPKPPVQKTEAVRQALAAGKDMPSAGVAWIKETLGVEVTNQQFSSYKTQEKAKGSAASSKAVPVPVASNGAVHRNGSVGHGLSLDAAKQVKELVGKFGAKTVKELAELFE